MGTLFQRITTALARFIGRPTMMLICLILAAFSFWSFFRGTDSLINGTNLAINILTLLFLPILQATQNRDGAALQAKLDELIKATKEARNDLIGIEDLDEEKIEELRAVPDSVTDPHPEQGLAEPSSAAGEPLDLASQERRGDSAPPADPYQRSLEEQSSR